MTLTDTARAVGVGVSNGTSGKAAFDRWFRYPAGLSQDALERLFSPSRNPSGGSVVDPFSGAATVGTRAASVGWSFIGVEAHPEIADLARRKLAPAMDAEELLNAALGVASMPTARGVESESDLVKRCFEPSVLSTLVGLREAVKAYDGLAAGYMKWALLATLRDVANVKVGWPYLRPNLARVPPHLDAKARFLTRVNWMIEDIGGRGCDPAAVVVDGDSGSPMTWTDPNLAEVAQGTVSLTSPPYLNNFDYADATRLEMYFWGRNASWREMVADVRSDMLVATTQQSSHAGAEFAIEGLADLPQTRRTVASLTSQLTAEKKKRKAGKQYDQVLPEYMLGITRVLRQLKDNLASGSWCGWVVGDSAPYGIYIDTPSLIQAAAAELGYTSAQAELIRPRGLRWRTSGMRHQVALNERLIWMRTPS